MSDRSINERHKERWAAATAENDGNPYLPPDVTQRLQEETRLEWVKRVVTGFKSSEPKKKPVIQQEDPELERQTGEVNHEASTQDGASR